MTMPADTAPFLPFSSRRGKTQMLMLVQIMTAGASRTNGPPWREIRSSFATHLVTLRSLKNALEFETAGWIRRIAPRPS